MPTKRARCVCQRCGKINYLPADGIDSSEAFLCEPCDDKFVRWCNDSQPSLYDRTVERFLKEKALRRPV